MDRFLMSCILVILLAFTTALVIAQRRIECGVPMGEQCSTDTECECLWGPDE